LIGIALTGYGMNEDVARSYEAGFVAHLIKPVEPESLDFDGSPKTNSLSFFFRSLRCRLRQPGDSIESEAAAGIVHKLAVVAHFKSPIQRLHSNTPTSGSGNS
jgi:CheY-like chemotaxis protein